MARIKVTVEVWGTDLIDYENAKDYMTAHLGEGFATAWDDPTQKITSTIEVDRELDSEGVDIPL